MGKSFCKIENKWCKYCKRGTCNLSDNVSRCPRLSEIETIRLADVLKDVEFENVFDRLIYWFSDQEKSKEGYRRVFNSLLTMKPKKHNLDDLFISITKTKDDLDPDDDREYINVSGVKVIGNDDKFYGIEFVPWNDWISMFITNETLNTLTKDDIVAGCLFEMTFFGFNEDKVQSEMDRICNSIEKAKNEL